MKPVRVREFAVNFQDGDVINPQYAFPHCHYILPLWAAVVIAIFAPIAHILVMQYRVKSFWDVNNAIFGLMYSIVMASFVQVFMKWLIGGLAPNFLEICQPKFPLGTPAGRGFRQIIHNSSICTNKNGPEIARALESFPSGGATVVFAGLIFLYLYLNAKLKVFANYHPQMWKLFLLYLPVLGAILIAGQYTLDKHHHWYDVFVGAAIGTVFAISAYRMVYASVWDFRFNHIPLNRTMPIEYGSPSMELTNTAFTTDAGWKYGEGTYGGAPSDSLKGHYKTYVVPRPSTQTTNNGSGVIVQNDGTTTLSNSPAYPRSTADAVGDFSYNSPIAHNNALAPSYV